MDAMTPPPDHQEHDWMLRARCRSLAPGEFFPSDGVGVDKARRICAQCSVQAACLEYALTYHIDHGVWGGASERERRRIMRQRRGGSRRGAPVGRIPALQMAPPVAPAGGAQAYRDSSPVPPTPNESN